MLLEAKNALSQLERSLDCKDQREECSQWASEGECDKNPGYMHKSCRPSCDKCRLSQQEFNQNLEIALLGVRCLALHCAKTLQRSKHITRTLAETIHASDTLVGRFNQRIPNKRSYLTRVAVFLMQKLESFTPVEISKSVISFKSTAEPNEKVVLSGSPEEAVYVLSNGVKMPLVGFGTWMLQGQQCYETVSEALKTGYRHIDTAQGYYNEKDVGRAIADSNVPREELFVATKISSQHDYGPGKVRPAFEKQLKDLGSFSSVIKREF